MDPSVVDSKVRWLLLLWVQARLEVSQNLRGPI